MEKQNSWLLLLFFSFFFFPKQKSCSNKTSIRRPYLSKSNLTLKKGMETLVYSINSYSGLSSLLLYKTVPSAKVHLRFVRCVSPASQCSRGTLRMAQSALNPVPRQQKIVIPNKYGEKLVGLLHETGSPEMVILCHGFRSNKDNNTMMNLAVALEKEGISAFRFDFAGNGESEGSFQYGNYRREADDLHSVIQHFSGAGRVISAILGHSKGGNVVLLYASKHNDIRTVINVSGRYDLNRGIAERLGEDFIQRVKENGFIDVLNRTGGVNYRVTEESLTERLSTDMREACLQINKECRVLTVHGSADEIIPVEDALEFAKIIPNHKLHIIQGADHGYTSHHADLTSIVLEFLKVANSH